MFRLQVPSTLPYAVILLVQVIDLH